MLQNNSKNKTFFILAIICIITLLPFVGSADFHTKGEPREAIVAYSMMETGNWILPTNNGGDMAYKPPFFHWAIAAFSELAGKVTEGTSRLPSALALIAMVLTGFLFYAKRRGIQVALITSFITLTAFEVHRAGLNCRVDMVLTAFIVMALYQLYHWCEKGQKGFPIIATIFMGIATLTKGPVGIILPCLVTGTYLLIKGTKFSKAFFPLVMVGIISCILPAIWYVLAYQQGGESFINLMMEENFGRFMGKMSYESHENPASYNFITVIAGFVPWTLLMIFSLFGLHYRKPQLITGWWKRFKNYIAAMDSTRLFSLLAIIIIFVFYCIPKSKRSVYLLPIYPFIAYFIAEYCIYLIHKAPKVIKAFGYTIAGICSIVIIAFFAIKLNLIPESLFTGRHGAENWSYVQALSRLPLNIYNAVLVLLPIIPAIYFIRQKTDLKSLYAIIGMLLALQVSLDGVYQPTVLNAKSNKKFALEIQDIIPQGPIYSFVSTEMLRYFVINFYNDNRILLFEEEQPENGYLLIGENDAESFISKYSENYIFNEVLKSTQRSNDTRQIMILYQFSKNK